MNKDLCDDKENISDINSSREMFGRQLLDNLNSEAIQKEIDEIRCSVDDLLTNQNNQCLKVAVGKDPPDCSGTPSPDTGAILFEEEDFDSDDELLFEAPIGITRPDSPARNSRSPTTVNHDSSSLTLGRLLSDVKVSVMLDKMDKQLKKDELIGDEDLLNSFLPKDDESSEDICDPKLSALLLKHSDHISDVAPGSKIFHPKDYKSIFSFPLSLHLGDCGWKYVSNFDEISTFLSDIDGEEILELISMGSFQNHCEFLTKSPRHCIPFMRFIFFIMSEADDIVTIDSCYTTLSEMITQAKETENNSSIFNVSFKIFATVLMNMGADISKLLNSIHELDSEMKQAIFSIQEDPTVDKPTNIGSYFPQTNLVYVLRILTIIKNFKIGSADLHTTQCLTIILLHISLDDLVRFTEPDLDFAIKECLSSLINCIPDEEFDQTIESLALNILELKDHHHNSVTILQMIPYDEKSLMLQTCSSFLYLQKFLDCDIIRFVLDVKPVDVLKLLRQYPLKREKDYYKLHSIISVIDLAVGNNHYSHYRDQILELARYLRNSLSWVRETIRCLDGSKLKDALIRLTSKWTFMASSMSHKQKKIFEYMDKDDSDETSDD